MRIRARTSAVVLLGLQVLFGILLARANWSTAFSQLISETRKLTSDESIGNLDAFDRRQTDVSIEHSA